MEQAVVSRSVANGGVRGRLEVVEAGTPSETSDFRWDAFVAASPHGHLLQGSRWGRHKANFGWHVERIVLEEGDNIVAGAQVLYRSLPLKLGTLAYVPMGPVVDWENAELAGALMSALQRAARRRRAFCLTVEPSLIPPGPATAMLGSHGLRPGRRSVQWRSTMIVNLDCTEDELLAQFHQDHRRKVRRAAREGVVVRPGTAADLAAFHALMEDTAGRKDFAVYPLDYYRSSYELFVSGGSGQLLLATHEGEIVAGGMMFVLGTGAYYMFAASSSAHRKLMPAYVVFWEGMRWARRRGCLSFDTCGIPDEVGAAPDLYAHEERHDGLWGVYRFKRGFGGQVVSYAGAYDRVYRRPLYALYNSVVDLLHDRLGENWNRRLFRG